MTLLEVEDLHVEFRTRHTRVHAVERLGFRIEPGEIVGLVGESGSGKSVTSLAIMGLLESPAGRITQGSLRFQGKELRGLSHDELRKLRGNRIAMIFQDPSTSLNPYLTVEEQLCEVGELHLALDRKAARKRAVELLEAVQAGTLPRTALDVLPELAETMTLTSICGLGQVAVSPALSLLRGFEKTVPAT